MVLTPQQIADLMLEELRAKRAAIARGDWEAEQRHAAEIERLGELFDPGAQRRINAKETTMSKNYTYRPSDHLAGSRSFIHGKLQPMDYPTTPRRSLLKPLFYAVVAILLVIAFDHVMKADAARLCDSDDTAYVGC